MLDALSLRDRLTYGYAVALLLGLVVFAAVSLSTVDYALKATVDVRLENTARSAIAVILDGGSASQPPVQLTHAQREALLLVLGSQGGAAVVRGDGSLLFDSESALPPALLRLAEGAGPRPRLATTGTADARVRTYAVRLGVARDGDSTLALVLWRPLDLIRELDRIALAVFVVAVVAIALLALVLGRAVAHRGLAPLRRIAALASEIEAHDLSRRLALPPHPDELGQLCTVFDRMLDRLQAAFERQRRFTADASHELRAPLSVIRVQADVALRREREPEQYRGTLEKIVRQAKELETLIAQLLAAARADAGTVERRPLDVTQVAADAAERARALGERKRITIRLVADGPATILGDASALERVFLSLLANAISFAPRGGSVDVIVRREAADVSVTIRDSGPGFSPEGLRHALERFWRHDAARGRGGSGLGLAIAKSIVEALDGTIALGNNSAGGADVTVRFPVPSTLPEPATFR